METTVCTGFRFAPALAFAPLIFIGHGSKSLCPLVREVRDVLYVRTIRKYWIRSTDIYFVRILTAFFSDVTHGCALAYFDMHNLRTFLFPRPLH